ncbi:hypothetical protein R3P38DRAFT_3027741 [Favolaschia claudopus]|uniref:F-box domain-containing protein n=1 Tax=Favolaschia claudopus TaxID=2862362 RepID=A0AAW0AE49_9AGAR
MRALSALPLGDDVLDRIFTFCPTFTTLHSLMLVSKAFYTVYQTHPRSITRAVAYNIVGPALPQALRAIRYPYGDDEDRLVDREYHKEDADTMATTCPEEHEVSVITAKEKIELQENAQVVQNLEDVYSLIEKDRTSATSVLTAEESWRFRRAMYRIMLYCRLFPGDRYTLDEIEDLEEEGIQQIQKQRTAVLAEYATDELMQLYAVVRFLCGILEHVIGDEELAPGLVYLFLSLGPDSILHAYEDRNYDLLEDLLGYSILEDDSDSALYKGYFSIPLNNIWTARNVTAPPKDDEPATKYILDEIIGANDTCSQCPTPGELKLITSANWHRVDLEPTTLLKSRLKHTHSIVQPFDQVVDKLRLEHAAATRAENKRLHLGLDFDDDNDGDDDDMADFLPPHIARLLPTPLSSLLPHHMPLSSSLLPLPANANAHTPLSISLDFTNDPTRTSPAPFYAAVFATPKPSAWAAWTQDKSYCQSCFKRFLEENVWRWYLREKIEGGWTPPEDCWYGYDCKTMVHKQAHAEGRNHLCVPTRGDGR